MDNIINNFRTDLIPDNIKKATEVSGLSVADFHKQATESYYSFINRGLELSREDGMDKQAMEKLSALDKQAIIGMSALAAAAAIPFGLWSAYDLAGNAWGGAKDIVNGRFGSAAKRLPAMAFDTMGTLPGVGVAGKAAKWGKALARASSTKAGLRGLRSAAQVVQESRQAPGVEALIKRLGKGGTGKGRWWNPLEWTQAGRARKVKELRRFRQGAAKRLADAKKAQVAAWGKGADKMSNIEGNISLKRSLGLSNKKPADADMINVFDNLHSEDYHKFYQHADPLDSLSMVRMAPMVPLLAGATTNNAALTNAGSAGLDFLNYYGESPEDAAMKRRALDAQKARSAIKAGGYAAGYMNS